MTRFGFFTVAGVLALLWSAQAHAQSQADLDWERERIQTHLHHIEELLREKDASHLTEAQQAAREASLDRLHEYTERGEFPRNGDFPHQRLPFFIDDRGTACAVGQLVIESGHEDTAHRIARENNNAYIHDLRDDPELRAWADRNGFTLEELALIQPAYCGPAFDAAPCDPDAGRPGEDAGKDAGGGTDAATGDAGDGDGGSKDGGCAAGGRPEGGWAALPLLALALLTGRTRRRLTPTARARAGS